MLCFGSKEDTIEQNKHNGSIAINRTTWVTQNGISQVQGQSGTHGSVRVYLYR